MYKISKEFEFCASHSLEYLRAGHPCSRMHGHNYKVIIELTSSHLNEAGFVMDYRDFDEIKNWIDNTFDHMHLNYVLPNMQTSTENLCKFIYDYIYAHFTIMVSAITIKETDKTACRYEPVKG